VTGTDVWLLAAAGLLVFVAGIFATIEAALSQVSRVRVENALRDGRRGASALAELVRDPARYLNVLAFLRIACELVATVLVVLVCIDEFSERWQAGLVAGAVMLVVVYIGVGVAPRTLGRQHAVGVALRSARLLRGLATFLSPLTKLLILVGNALTPGKGFAEGPFASEAELRDLVDLAQENRVIEAEERAMIHSVFELGDTMAREVMVPRTDMVFIERTKTLRQAMSLALRSGFSRIPVIGEGLDDVVGVVYLKDLTRRTHEYHDGESTERVDSVMRPATFVPETKPVDELLRQMRAEQTHIAVVVDEYGGTAGLVTIEDIIEEIVGEIADEYDREAPQVERLGNGAVRVSARLHVEELGDLFGVHLDDDDVDSVGGLLAKHLGRVPIPGTGVEVEGLRLTAEGTYGRRNQIGTVLVTRAGGAGDEPEERMDTAADVAESQQPAAAGDSKPVSATNSSSPASSEHVDV
jgi:CBS domain containing-hemolysin-like protein